MQLIREFNVSNVTTMKEINNMIGESNGAGILIDVFITPKGELRLMHKKYPYFSQFFNNYYGTVVYRFNNGTRLSYDSATDIGILLAGIRVLDSIILTSSNTPREVLNDIADTIYSNREVKRPVHVAAENVSDLQTGNVLGDMIYSYTTRPVNDRIYGRVLSYLNAKIPVLVSWPCDDGVYTRALCEQTNNTDLLTIVNRDPYIRKMESR